MVIVPTYNENLEIVTTVAESWLAAGVDICLIDDGSQNPIVVAHERVVVVRHERNRGQGAAIATGLAHGLKGSYDYFLTVDADGQHPAQNLAALVSPLLSGRADIVFGSRFLKAHYPGTLPKLRGLVLRLAVRFNNYITGLPMTDAHNGLRAMNRRAATQIHLSEDRMAHASEFPIRVRQTGLNWCEVPVEVRYTAYATKKGQPLWRAFPLSWQLIKLKWRNE